MTQKFSSAPNYLGLACLLDALFSGSKREYNERYTQGYDLLRKAELDDRYDNLSERIDELESRLDETHPESELYDDIELLRDELNEIEDECDDFDDY